MKDEIGKPDPKWGGAEIFGVLVVMALCQAAARAWLDAAGWAVWYYGEPVSDERLSLWSSALALAMQALAAVGWLRFSCGATLADVGFTSRRLGRNVSAGLLAAVVIPPGCYALHALAILATKAAGMEEQPHLFTRLGQEGLDRAEWTLLITSAVVLAPLWEELLFRGVVQPWAVARPWAGAVLFVVAVVVMFTLVLEAKVTKTPFVVLAALVPVYLLLQRRSVAAGGLFATAVLFAWVHAMVWPTPVPLLWLALGLGWLRWKTGSIVGCLVLHAVFNAVGVVTLLWLKAS